MTQTATPRVRMSPEGRREQLLDIGVGLLATGPLEQVSTELVAERAGISRGLLYHYFPNLAEFHRAVLRRAVQELFELTAPDDPGDAVSMLFGSLAAYLDYVSANRPGYISLVRAAATDQQIRELYEEARDRLSARIFERAADGGIELVDTAGTRLLVRGWTAMVEAAVLTWLEDPAGLTRKELLDAQVAALVGLLGLQP